MVQVTDFKTLINADGEPFNALTLMGDITFVLSSKTGNFYATAWKGSISTTFSEEVCKGLVGKSLPGEIQKVDSEPYEYTIPSTGETIMLTHKYRYNPNPNEETMEEAVFTPEAVSVEA